MASALSEVAICNLALSWLGANLITSFDDDSTESKLCGANYEPLRDAVLEAYQWSFATRRVRYGAAVEDPSEQEDDPYRMFRFKIPPDVLRILKVRQDNDFRNPTHMEWQVELGHILAEQTPVFAEELVRVSETTQFSVSFTQALAARIAADLAAPITESVSKQETMYALYLTKLGDAKTLDSMQGKSTRIRSSWMKNSRQRTSSSGGLPGSLAGSS